MSWLKNRTSWAALTGESLSYSREVWCHCCACPTGDNVSAAIPSDSDWAELAQLSWKPDQSKQQSDHSRELKCGNQIDIPLPVSWFRTGAVVGGGWTQSSSTACPFPVPPRQWLISLPTAILQAVTVQVNHTREEGQVCFSVGCALGIVNEPLMSTSFYILGCVSFL